jgi:L-threonylcarbamoyladenylate synthase
MTVAQISDQKVKEAADLLRRGRLVAFPTETVYGLGADASNEEALKLLYQVKGRPGDHPVIVHIASTEQLSQWAKDIPQAAYELAKAFWPGPLTLILPRADHVSTLVTGGQDSIGLRVPSHPIANRLLQAFGGGVAAPSANRFGKLSPTSAEAVREGLGQDIDLILDGGLCEVGIESTIVSLIGERPSILRPGMIDQKMIEQVLGEGVTMGNPAGETDEAHKQQTIRVPGALESHYSPRTPMAVAAAEELIELFAEGMTIGRSQGVLAFASTVQAMKDNFGEGFYSALPYEGFIVAPDDAEGYAHMLYESLRTLDQLSLHKILVEAVPGGTHWDGVRDRLARASARKLRD